MFRTKIASILRTRMSHLNQFQSNPCVCVCVYVQLYAYLVDLMPCTTYGLDDKS